MTHNQIFLHYHEGNHIVRCPKCRHCIVRTSTKRIYSNSNFKQQYLCLTCGCQFICCAKKYSKDVKIRLRINQHKQAIWKLEKRLMEKSY